jgi:hypothetical protein
MIKGRMRKDVKRIEALKLPARGLPTKRVIYVFPDLKGEVEGGSFKLYLRDVLKKVPTYHIPVEVDVYGRTADGVPIKINTLGRWLFGVPGYAGNARFLGISGEVFRVEVWCGGCGDDVIEVLDKLFAYVGGKR